MTHEPVGVLRENLEIAARMHYHLERSHQQIADDVPLHPGQVSQYELLTAKLARTQQYYEQHIAPDG